MAFLARLIRSGPRNLRGVTQMGFSSELSNLSLALSFVLYTLRTVTVTVLILV